MPNVVEIIVEAKNITKEGFASAAKDAETAGTEAGGKFSNALQKSMSAASKIGATAFAAGLGLAVEQGQKLQESQDSLDQAIKNTGGSMDKYAPQLDAVRSRMESLGFSNADVDSSIAKLTTATGSAGTAIALESTAANLAAARHISLSSATDMLSKAAGGSSKGLKDLNVTVASGATWAAATASANKILGDQISSAGGMANFARAHHLSLADAQKLVGQAAAGSVPALNKLGIDVLPKSATAAQRVGELTAIMNTRIGGDAAAAANTSAGKFAVLKSKFDDVAASVGQKLLPPLTTVLTFISNHAAAVTMFAAAIGALLIASRIASAIKDMAAAIKVMNLAMIASPWTAIAVAVVALAVVIIKYHTQIWNFVTKIWSDIKNFVVRIWNDFLNFAKQWWPLLLGVGGVIWKYHDDIWKFIQKIWNDVFDFVKKIWNDIWNNTVGRIKDGIHDAENLFDDFRNGVGDKFNNIKKDIAGYWDTIYKNTIGRVGDIGRDVKKGFQDLSDGIGRIWTGVEGVVQAPVRWVVKHVFNPMIDAFDWITSKVGGPHIADIPGWQTGRVGRVGTGYGGGDTHLALLEEGESVVPKELTPKIAPWLKAHGVPGHQFGWVGDIGKFAQSAWHGITDAASLSAAIATGNAQALTNTLAKLAGIGPSGAIGDMAGLLTAIPKKIISSVVDWITHHITGGSGAAIADYAKTFVGKVPYVWGGTTTAGWDCSGFTSYVYDHFGYNDIPRTSEAQALWVKKAAPVPGGLAFFSGSDGTPSAPGHVGIVTGPNQMVDAYATGYGTRLDSLAGMLFAGIPPGGFKAAGGGGAPSGGKMSNQSIAALWQAAGGPGGLTAQIAAAIAGAESGDNPSMVQSGEPPGLTGYGLWQITPTSGITQNGRFGNLLNALNNAKAAVYLYNQAGGFSPWATYGSGAYMQFLANGGITNGKMAVVGEMGRELVRLPSGSQVYPHGQSEAMLAAQQRQPNVINFHFPHYVGTHNDLVKAVSDLARRGRLPGLFGTR